MTDARPALTEIPFGLPGRVYRSRIPSSPTDPIFAAAWEADVAVVVILEQRSRWPAGARDLDVLYRERGWSVLYVPLWDGTAPALSNRTFPAAVAEVAEYVAHGRNVLIHCLAGRGRTGMFLACLARLQLGLPAQKAIDWVRESIPGAVEEDVQEDYVRRVSLTARACDDDNERFPLGATDHERVVIRAIAKDKRRAATPAQARGDLRLLVSLAARGYLRNGGYFDWGVGSWLDQRLREHADRCAELAQVTLFEIMTEPRPEAVRWSTMANSMLVRAGADGVPNRPGAPEALLCACSERLAEREHRSRTAPLQQALKEPLAKRWAAYLASPEMVRSFAVYFGARCPPEDAQALHGLLGGLDAERRAEILGAMRRSSHPFWKRFAGKACPAAE